MAPKPEIGPTGQRRSVADEPVTTVLKGDVPVGNDDWDADDEILAALGYKPEFKREFSLFTTFSVSFAVLGLLPSFASTLYYGMGYAGTAGMTWGWIVAMIGIQCVAMSMAELCSAMPTSGGLYYAAAALAPPGWGPLAAWITGWSNWLVQVTAAPSVNYGTAAMLLASASITNPAFVPKDYQVFLLSVFLMIIHGFISSMPTKWLAQFNAVGSTFNMIALVIVIILIPATTNREDRGLPRFAPNDHVWGHVFAGTDWPDGVSILMSFIGVIWAMSGYDAPFHLAEECSNANIASPRAIVMTSTFGGLFGWFLQLVVAYTVVNINGALESDLGQPFAAYLMQALPQNVALTILAFTIIAGFAMGQACMVAASRVTFAYARDGCFPLSHLWAKVNTTTRTPVNAVWINVLVGVLCLLLVLGGPLTVGALFSIGAIAAFVAFTLPIFIRVFLVGDRFKPGPWHLGKFSLPIGAFASAFVGLMIPILCLPYTSAPKLTAEDMNWTCLVYGGPMLFAMIWWFASARKWFKGPRVNLEHRMLGERTNIEGKNHPDGSDHGSDSPAPADTKTAAN